MNISIQFVPSATQRYDTWGDWYYDDKGDLIIKVSDDEYALPTEDHQFLVALHELVEVYLCKKRGITQQMVDDFDFGKQEYCNLYGLEPGDMEDAPYRKEHRFACIVEHMVAHELGLVGYGKVE